MDDTAPPSDGGTPPPTPPPAPAPRRRRRVWLIVLALVVGVLALLAGTLTWAPQLIARYVANTYLKGIEVDAEGVSTLRINLWRQEISFGPVTFRGGTATAGQVGSLGVRFDLGRLFEKRALLQTVVIEGVRLDVTQGPDGELSLNGIPLRQILAERQQDQQQPVEDKPGGVWGAGLDSLELRDSRLVFTNNRGGTVTLAIASLLLEGFQTWTPDQPGLFRLAGSVNGMSVGAEGEATPFASDIGVETTLTVGAIELPKLEEYTGPLGFQPAAGVGQVTTHAKAALRADGNIDAAVTGKASVTGVDLAHPDMGHVTATDASLDFDSSIAYGSDGGARILGEFNGGTGAITVRLAEGPLIGLDGSALTITDVALTVPAAGEPTLVASPRIEVRALRVAGPVELGLDKAVLALPKLKVTPGAEAVALDGGASIALDTLAVRQEAFAVAVGGIGLEVKDAAIRAGADIRIKGQLTLMARELNTGTAPANGGGSGAAAMPALAIGAVEGQWPTLDIVLVPANGTTTIAATGTLGLAPVRVTRAATAREPGFSAELARLDVRVDELGLTQAADTRVQGGLVVTAHRLDATVSEPPRAGRAHATKIATDRLEASATPLRLTATPAGALELATGGLVRLTTVKASLPGVAGAPSGEITLRDARLDYAQLVVKSAPGALSVNGRATSQLGPLSSQLLVPAAGGPRAPPLPVRASLGGARLDLTRLAVTGTGNAHDLTLAGVLRLNDLVAGNASQGATPRRDVELRTLRVTAGDVNASLGGGGGRWQWRGEGELRGFAFDLDQGKLATMRVGGIVLEAAQASSKPEFAARRLVIDDLNALYVQVPNYTPPGVIAAEEAVERMTWPPPGLPRLRLDAFAVTGKSGVVFRDDTLTPPRTVVVSLDTLSARDIDTAQPRRLSDIRLDATLNRVTTVRVNGSVAPFQALPDFNLAANVTAFDLPFVSPFVQPTTGIAIRRGQLSADVTGAANDGQLKGDVRVRIRELDIGVGGGERANRLSGLVGVPINSIVGLLENNEGVIDLNLPVSGDLRSPSFDFTDAIGKALTGTLRTAVLAPFKLAAAPVTLLGGLVGGGDTGGDTGGGLALDPIAFAPGGDRPDLSGQSGMASLAEVLKQRNTLKLEICGVANGRDFTALAGEVEPGDRERLINRFTPELQRLAESRALNVRQALTETGGVAADQVRMCDVSRVEPDDDGAPRVEIGF